MNKWVKDPNGTSSEGWLDVLKIEGPEYEDLKYFWSHAGIKFDGCVYINIAGNIPFSSEDGSPTSGTKRSDGACDNEMHICNIDDMIEDLLAIKKIAKEHFKNREEWNEKIK